MLRRVFRADRWWVAISIGVGLALVVIALLPRPAGVYASETSLLFLAPNADSGGNPLRADSQSLIYFAAAVEREFNGRPAKAKIASTGATLYGMGVRHGSRVTLLDVGGQWRTNFSRALLQVEVVSGSPQQTRAELNEVLGRLKAIAEERQLTSGVAESSMIRTEASPAEPVVQYVGGSRKRESIALLLLGLTASVTIRTMADRGRGPHRKSEPMSWTTV